jgi:putative acetyltransferase
MEIKSITELSDDVDALIQLSRDFQAEIYPAECINQDDPEYLISGSMYFIGAYSDEVLLGIGGVKIMHDDGDYGEIKNLFVDPKARGRGVSKKIMQALEDYLSKNEIPLCRLETGVSQPESIGLYKSLGYEDRDAYGKYASDALSVFMEKVIE